MESVSLLKSGRMKAGKVTLLPGEEIGEHVTERREEILLIRKGSGILLADGKSIQLKEGDVHHIPEGVRHNVKNQSQGRLEYIYIVALF